MFFILRFKKVTHTDAFKAVKKTIAPGGKVIPKKIYISQELKI